MVIYFNNNELSTTPIFSTTFKGRGILCEYVNRIGGDIYLKVYKLFVKGLWLYFKSMKVIFYYSIYSMGNILLHYM